MTNVSANFDLLGMMKDRDRAELRMLLHQQKLLFLRPKYREEQFIDDDKGELIYSIYFI